MNDLPKCKLCGTQLVNAPTDNGSVILHDDAKQCPLRNVMLSEEQWRTLMSGPTLRRLRDGDVPNSDPMKVPLTAFYDPDGKEFIGYDTPQGADPSHIIENLPGPEDVE